MKFPGKLSSFFFASCLAFAAKEPTLDELKAKAEAGDVKAQVLLGAKYDFGNGARRDYAEAAKWYEHAAKSGDAIAQNNLGSFYQEGLGVPRDYAKAFELFKKSAEQGFADAQCSLGLMFDLGQGVAQNRSEANVWYRKAAEQGFPRAMLNLGVNCAGGVGVPKDLIQAFMWLDVARFFTQRSSDMKEKWRMRGALDEVQKQMSQDQIKQGSLLSNDWIEKFRSAHPKI